MLPSARPREALRRPRGGEGWGISWRPPAYSLFRLHSVLRYCYTALSLHGRQQLCSTASGTLLVPPARTATGQRSFAINGPRTCCWQVGSEPFVRRRCDCSASSATFTYIQTYLLTSIGPCYGMVPYMRLSFRPGAIIPEWKVVEMSNLVKIFSLARVINVLILE